MGQLQQMFSQPDYSKMGFFEKLGHTWPARTLQELFSAAKLPGEVYAGQTQVFDPQTGHVSQDVIQRSADLAGGVTLGAGALPASRNTLRAGASMMNAADGLPIKDGLIAHHNISSNGLRFNSELGGLPMPSIAVSKIDEPLTNFGEISLIGGREFAEPSARNKVFVGDAYTGRQPKADITFKDQDAVNRAIAADPRFSHTRDAKHFTSQFDDAERADRHIRKIEAAIAKGLDPKQYDDMVDMSRAADKVLEYKSNYDGTMGIEQFGETEKTLFSGFSPSGNRRKPKPYTLDVVMDMMRKQKAGEKGSENFNYGPSSFRANQLEGLKSFVDVTKARGRVMSEEKTKEAFEAFSQKHGDIAERVGEASGISGYSALDAATEFMADYASGKGNTWKHASWTNNLPDSLKKEIIELGAESRRLPANYMEIKPQRVVDLSEFKGAIVPKNIDPETLAVLKSKGINRIEFYEDEAARKSLFKKFPEFTFMGAGAAGLAAAASPDQAQAQQQNDSLGDILANALKGRL